MLKRKSLDLSVYFIAEPQCCLGRPVLEVVHEAVAGGVTIVQYRDKSRDRDKRFKEARELAEFLKPLGIPFIINDYVHLARLVGADGVHLGRNDMKPKQARDYLGPTRIIGVTAFEPSHFAEIDTTIVDYAGVGACYPTKTKPDKKVLTRREFAALVKMSPVPVVGVGGITPDNAVPILAAGARGVGMQRAISESPDPRAAAEAFVRAVKGRSNDPEYLIHRGL